MSKEKPKEQILFIHGFPMTDEIWENVLEDLNNIHTCYAPKLPGYGTSVEKGFNHSIKAYGDFIIDYLDQKGLFNVHVVGISMGGMISMELAQRKDKRIKSISVLHTTAKPDTELDMASRNQTITFIEQGNLPQFIDQFATKLLSPSASKAIHERYVEIMSVVEEDVVIDGYKAIRDRGDLYTGLKDITIPVLFLAGRDDAGATPEEMKDMADQVINSRFEVFDNCGHVSPLEKPEKLNKLLKEWVDNQ